MTERKISSIQLAMLLAISIFATTLSQTIFAVDMIAYPLGMGIVWIGLIPSYLLFRRQQFFPALAHIGKWILIPIALVFLGLCLFFTAQTLGWFSDFMISTVYPAANGGIFLCSMAVVCAYGAGMGLEPLARFSLWALILALVAVALLYAGAIPLMRTAFLREAFYQIWGNLPRGTFSIVLGASDSLLFLLLFSRVRQSSAPRTSAGSFLTAGILSAVAALLVTVSLGEFGENFQFPLYTVATAAHFSPQGRMDLLYLFLFIFTVFTRASLWLYGACICLRRLFPRWKRGLCASLCGIAAAGISLLPVFSESTILWISGGIWGLILLLPLLLICAQRGGKA